MTVRQRITYKLSVLMHGVAVSAVFFL